MHIVAFMYPGKAGTKFDVNHFLRVHLPMGLSLTRKHLQLVPKKIVVYTDDTGAGRNAELSPYLAISSVFFDEEEDAKTFAGLFSVEEAARLLSADFPNYTPAPPHVLVAKVTELHDLDAMIRAYDANAQR